MKGESKKYYTSIRDETIALLESVKNYTSLTQGEISILAGYSPSHIAQNISANKMSKRAAHEVRLVCKYIARYPYIFEKPLTRDEMLAAIDKIEGDRVPATTKEQAQVMAMLRVLVNEVAEIRSAANGGSPDAYVQKFFDRAKLILDTANESF